MSTSAHPCVCTEVCSLERESLTESRVKLVTDRPQLSLQHHPISAGVMGIVWSCLALCVGSEDLNCPHDC